MPDGLEGAADEIVNQIVTFFRQWTVPEQRGHPMTSERIQETPDAALAEIQTVDPSGQVDVPRPLVVRSVVASVRTYQLLFETARRELDRAEIVPASSRYFLVSGGILVAMTAEAFFNDLGSRMIPSWAQLQRLDPREKAEVLSIELFNRRVDWNVRPFQSVAAALGFRRALAHAHAETLASESSVMAGQTEVPRTRRTAWQEYCDLGTIQRWITDVRAVIEELSRRQDSSV